jgi:HEAT repeat protein
MTALAAALVALALAAGDPATSTPGDVRARVEALLGVLDGPVSPEPFRELGAEGEAALAEIARSGDLPPWRARALEVLAALQGAQAEELHREIAADHRAPRTVRRAAVRGLGRIVPPARASAALLPILEGDRDGAVRAAAAEALTSAGPPGACAAVRAQARREGKAGETRFRRALAPCAPR